MSFKFLSHVKVTWKIICDLFFKVHKICYERPFWLLVLCAKNLASPLVYFITDDGQIPGNKLFLSVKINVLHVLSAFCFMEITSKFRTFATFVTVDSQTLLYTWRVSMFVMYVRNSLHKSYPIVNVLSQVVHCLEFSKGFEYTSDWNLPQPFLFNNTVVQRPIFVIFWAVNNCYLNDYIM